MMYRINSSFGPSLPGSLNTSSFMPINLTTMPFNKNYICWLEKTSQVNNTNVLQ